MGQQDKEKDKLKQKQAHKSKQTHKQASKQAQQQQHIQSLPEPDEENENDNEEEYNTPTEDAEYEVEQILSHMVSGGRIFFLIQWKGFTNEDDNTWEKEANLEGSPELLTDYFAANGGRDAILAQEKRPATGSKRKRKRARTSTTTTATSAAATTNDLATSPKPVTSPASIPINTPFAEHDVAEVAGISQARDGTLVFRLALKSGSRRDVDAAVMYACAPQAALRFFEANIVFRDKDDDDGDDDDAGKAMPITSTTMTTNPN
ncbi:hypothetical protein V1514DRAFT_40890 [Lipomyces japonicus]|uniref:uncharacterized protein n=1 Tax=Lipomyces japonicus TaxID=56871 RepID=UPI0034CDC406